MKRLKHNKASSMIEYCILAATIMLAAMAMHKYAIRALAGHWKKAGDIFGYERQFDSETTEECVYSGEYDVWAEPECTDKCRRSFHFSDCLEDLIERIAPGEEKSCSTKCFERYKVCWKDVLHSEQETCEDRQYRCKQRCREKYEPECQAIKDSCIYCSCYTDSCNTTFEVNNGELVPVLGDSCEDRIENYDSARCVTYGCGGLE